MFKALLSKQMSELFTFFIAGKKDKKRSTGQTVGVILLAIFVVAMLTVVFVGMALSLCIPLCEAGHDWLYFTIMGGLSFILGVVGSAFTAYSGLFVAKDNEMLLSMPIKPKFIVFVRMLSLYIISFVFDSMVLLSSGIIYLIFGDPSITSFIFYPIALLVLPMLSLTVSCILGWIIALIAPHVKNKSLVTTIISVAFMGLYFVFCFNMSDYLEAMLINIGSIADSIKGSAYLLYLFGAALSGEPLPFLGFLVISLAVFGAVYYAISKTFLKLSTLKKSGAKIKYQAKEMKVASVKSALLKRELKHLFYSTTYLLNCGIGVVMIALAAIFALIEQGSLKDVITALSAEMPEIFSIVPAIIATVLSFMMSMTIISAPSVSLEGRSIWIVQSLPVRGRDVLRSKVMLHAVTLTPAATLCALVLCVVTDVGFVATVSVLLYTISTSLVGAYLGVVINLLMPKLDFTNETVAVKQSGSVIVTMLILMALDVVHGILFFTTFIFIPSWVTVGIAAVIGFIACAIMDSYLSNSGERRFASLS